MRLMDLVIRKPLINKHRMVYAGQAENYKWTEETSEVKESTNGSLHSKKLNSEAGENNRIKKEQEGQMFGLVVTIQLPCLPLYPSTCIGSPALALHLRSLSVETLGSGE